MTKAGDRLIKAALEARRIAASAFDWPEDFIHENGNYWCTCSICKKTFSGHKRRVVCRKCANQQ